MTGTKILAVLVALAMIAVGVWLALAGWGVTSGGSSMAWSIIGAGLVGFGIALIISLFQRRG